MSTSLAALFLTVSATFHLPPVLLSAVCFVESSHNTKAINKNDGIGHSMGVCQIKHSSAVLLGFTGTEEQLLTPEINVHYAGFYLRHQLSRYDNDYVLAISAYNA